jgi:hypothetical protein
MAKGGACEGVGADVGDGVGADGLLADGADGGGLYAGREGTCGLLVVVADEDVDAEAVEGLGVEGAAVEARGLDVEMEAVAARERSVRIRRARVLLSLVTRPATALAGCNGGMIVDLEFGVGERVTNLLQEQKNQ